MKKNNSRTKPQSRVESYESELYNVVKSNGKILNTITIGNAVREGLGKILRLTRSVRDITERKKIQDELDLKRETYKSLFDQNPDGVYSFDLEGNFTSANQALADMAECTVDELLKITFAPLVTAECLDQVWEHFRQAARGIPQNYDAGVVSTKGKKFCVNITNMPIVVAGKITGVYGIAKDITEKRKAENNLKQSEQKFRSVLQTAQDAVILADETKKIIYWNAAAEKMFGYSQAEIIGQPLTIIMPPEFKKQFEVRNQHPHNSGSSPVIGKVLEFRGLRKDGTEFPVEHSISAWETDNGKIYCGIIRNITDRKKAESALIDSEFKFRSVLQTAKDAIILANQHGEIIFWNQYAVNLFGYSENEVAGRQLSVIVPENMRAAHEKGFRHHIETGISKLVGKMVEVEGQRKNGTVFPIELTLSSWESNGEKFFCGIVRDITKRKNSENEIQQQLEELQKWHEVSLNREERIMEVKKEVNKLLRAAGEKEKYDVGEGEEAGSRELEEKSSESIDR